MKFSVPSLRGLKKNQRQGGGGRFGWGYRYCQHNQSAEWPEYHLTSSYYGEGSGEMSSSNSCLGWEFNYLHLLLLPVPALNMLTLINPCLAASVDKCA